MRPITKVRYSAHFTRAFKKLNSSLAGEVARREALFRQDCFHSSLKTHALKGKLEGFWSFSVTRRHRILFQFLSVTEVYFVDVDDHDLYR